MLKVSSIHKANFTCCTYEYQPADIQRKHLISYNSRRNPLEHKFSNEWHTTCKTGKLPQFHSPVCSRITSQRNGTRYLQHTITEDYPKAKFHDKLEKTNPCRPCRVGREATRQFCSLQGSPRATNSLWCIETPYTIY